MNAELTRRGFGLVILLGSTLWMIAFTAKKSRLSAWVVWAWAVGFVVTLA